jgi:hypothetical protein
MSTPASTPAPDPDLMQLAVRFLDTMMSSADVETIGRTAWWGRARTALETGAATGTRFSEVVSTTARKLEITGALSASTSAEIVRLALDLDDPAVFAAWRELAQSDAIYVLAFVRMARTQRKENSK